MKRKSCITVSLLFTAVLCSMSIFAQKGHKDQKHADKKLIAEAEDAFDRMDYLRAFKLYEEVHAHDSSNWQAVHRMGYSLFAVDKCDTNCLRYFRASKNRIPESHYYLGRIYHLEGKEQEALEEYHRFESLNEKEKEIKQLEVRHYIVMAEIALKEEARKQSLIVRNIGNKINSAYSDYVPLIWNVNGDLIFTSRREGSTGGQKDPYGHFYEDIYIAQRSGEGWTAPSPLSNVVNTDNHDACVAFSPDGNELLIYRTDENLTGGDLYVSKFDGNTWSAPVKLGPEINSAFLETSACYSAYGNEIVFSSNRPGGFGGKDLYITRKFMNGKYSLPRNLGPLINSPEDEDAPFIDRNDNTLYFSSRGHDGIGEYDIFSCAYNNALDRWEKPENLGMPINSQNDDIYFIKIEDSNRALFTSRREGGFGDADIYSVNFSESSQTTVYLKFDLENIKNRNALGGLHLTMHDDEHHKVAGSYLPNREYMSMVLVAEIGKVYRIVIEGKGTETVTLLKSFTADEKEWSVKLKEKMN